MKTIFLILICILSFNSVAQKKFNGLKKISNAKGTFWGYWGYNRSAYTKSDIAFKALDYGFTLYGASASDNQSKGAKNYLSLKTLAVPQFNLAFGYYYTNKYAVSIAYDHMKYVLNDGNQVLLDGYIKPGIDSTWSGTYNNEQVVTNRNNFHYEHTNGMNYFRIQLTRSDKLYQSKNKIFALSTNLGLGVGCVMTVTNFTFAQQADRNVSSFSGYGISAHGSFRFEFFRHFFIQPEISGGSMNLSHVKIRKTESAAFAKQQFWYGQRSLVAGIFIYFKPKNSCQDCPVW